MQSISQRAVRRIVSVTGSTSIGALALLSLTVAPASAASWIGVPGGNVTCDITATTNLSASRAGTGVGPIGGAIGNGCAKVRVTVNSYYAGQPRTVTKTTTVTLTNVVATTGFSGAYLNSTHCGLDFRQNRPWGCHTFRS